MDQSGQEPFEARPKSTALLSELPALYSAAMLSHVRQITIALESPGWITPTVWRRCATG
jgi:hypothetical protein